MYKIITNKELYNWALNNFNVFKELEQLVLPVSVGYKYIYNKTLIFNLIYQIEDLRKEIIKKYGKIDEDGHYKFESNEFLQKANEEIQLILEEKQELKLKSFTLKDLKDISLTIKQIEVLSLMISEEE